MRENGDFISHNTWVKLKEFAIKYEFDDMDVATETLLAFFKDNYNEKYETSENIIIVSDPSELIKMWIDAFAMCKIIEIGKNLNKDQGGKE